MDGNTKLWSFIEATTIEEAGETVRTQLKEAVADLFAAAIAGTRAECGRIMRDFVSAEWGTGRSTVFLSDMKLSGTGAALINANMANALDVDDGQRLTKGHPGAVVIPAIVAAAEEQGITGGEFLNAVLVAYEVGIRAAILAHDLRPEYHCTGSWGSIASAAGVARVLGLKGEQIEHALGIAEYHSTYAPMMRCIDIPSMLKDAICWGCMVGISSARLAERNFTGIPSLFGFDEAVPFVESLGERYFVLERYYKPHTCCRWAQPAVEGAKAILADTPIAPAEIEKIFIHTFEESARLRREAPKNTEEAQYNLYFPMAATLVFGECGPRQVLDELENPEILGLMDRIETKVDPEIDSRFPAKAMSRVEIVTKDCRNFLSPIMQARGDFDFPLSSEELRAKFFWLTEPVLGEERSREVYQAIMELEEAPDLSRLMSLVS